MVVGKIQDNDTYAFGFDAQTGKFENLVSHGIIDPTKVVRTRWSSDEFEDGLAHGGASRLCVRYRGFSSLSCFASFRSSVGMSSVISSVLLGVSVWALVFPG